MKSKVCPSAEKNNISAVASGVERRKFITRLAALGASAILPTEFLHAQVSPTTPVKPFRIDAHHHFSAPGFIAAISARKTNQRPLELWTPEKSIEDMDKSGVATSMVYT